MNPSARPRRRPTPSAQPAVARPTALVVDDDPASRALLGEFLALEGIDSTGAAEAWSALQLLGAARPQLVCVDLMLPGVSGFELCERIRRDPALRGVKLLVVSARALPQDRALALEAGADAFIGKPVDRGELAAALARLLAAREGGGAP